MSLFAGISNLLRRGLPFSKIVMVFSIETTTLTLRDHAFTERALNTPQVKLKSALLSNKNAEIIPVSNAFNLGIRSTQQFIHYQISYKWICDRSLVGSRTPHSTIYARGRMVSYYRCSSSTGLIPASHTQEVSIIQMTNSGGQMRL